MKQPIKIALNLFAFLVFVFFPFSSNAQQQFKWVTGGGTNQSFGSDPIDDWEQTQYMCTDADGNIYALSQVGYNAIYADTFIRLSGAYGSYPNTLITSYNCNGRMRWAKLIGSDDGQCIPTGIVADSLGHIYVTGYFQNLGTHLYIGYDTTTPTWTWQSDALIQFDTFGHFYWLRYVGDNSRSTDVGTGNIGSVLTVDAANNVHYFNCMGYGVHITPTETSISGTYDLVYNPSGTLLSSARIDLDSQWYFNSAVIDPITNKLYATGQNGGGFVTDSFFAAAFDSSRNLIWQYFPYGADVLTGVSLDQSKHLYFSGAADPTAFYFNGDSIFATGFFAVAVLMKTDTNGHPEWIRHYDSHSSINGFEGVTALPNNTVAAVGTFAENVTSGAVSFSLASGQDPYFVIVDSAGNLQTMQQIYGDGFYNAGSVITSDKVGNIYIGGYVTDSIYGGTIPAYHSVGGNTDFYVMKYGVDCSCTSGPAAAFTDTGTHHTIGVTYTGTTSGLDSVVWNFGDGAAATGVTATHTYSVIGTYEVCATVYTDCGVDEHCSDFVDSDTHVLVSSVTASNIRVYPNPARDELNVTGLVGNTGYRLLNVTGSCVAQGALLSPSGSISMEGISPGVYILEMTGLDGGRDIVRVVKE